MIKVVPEGEELELQISQLASDLAVGPKVYATTINNDETTILMDRYDGTLDQLLYACQDECCLISGILDRLSHCIRTLHQNGIVHNDFTLDNILFSYTGQIVVADYGLARFSREDRKRKTDWRLYHRIRTEIDQVQKGKRFSSQEELFRTMTPSVSLPSAL